MIHACALQNALAWIFTPGWFGRSFVEKFEVVPNQQSLVSAHELRIQWKRDFRKMWIAQIRNIQRMLGPQVTIE